MFFIWCKHRLSSPTLKLRRADNHNENHLIPESSVFILAQITESLIAEVTDERAKKLLAASQLFKQNHRCAPERKIFRETIYSPAAGNSVC
jgi:hypothetical protein